REVALEGLRFDPVAPLLLRALARELGRCEQVRQPLALGGGHADTDRHRQRLRAVDIADLSGGCEDLLADVEPVRDRALRQKHREAVASESAREPIGSRRATDDFGDALYHLVARMEAERFVDGL